MDLISALQDCAVLRAAWTEVAARRGAAGIDRVTTADFAAALDNQLTDIALDIANGDFRFRPVLRVRASFLRTCDRPLVIPTVRDRVVQRAISDLLVPSVEPLLSPACRAYGRGFSAAAAAEDADGWIRAGHPWVLRADVLGYFDHIQPALLLEMLEPLVEPRSLHFLGRVLRQRIFDYNHVTELVNGIPQGSPLSPLLGNFYLAALDHDVHRAHPCYIRYCDDLIVLAASEGEIRAAHERIVRGLAPLGLELKSEKTRICRAEDGFTFLGFHFGASGRGPATRAVNALDARLAELEASSLFDAEEVEALYRGWTGYFGADPVFWRRSPAGILALLRASPGRVPEAAMRAARRSIRRPISRPLALELARAWVAAGDPAQAWLELISAGPTVSPDDPWLESWSEILRVPQATLRTVLRAMPSGTLDERATEAAERLAHAGEYAAGHALAAAALELQSVDESARGPGGAAAGPDESDLDLLGDWFQGREGIHARQTTDGAGRKRYRGVRRPIRAQDWIAHLKGETILALPLVRAGNTVLVGVLDIDLDRRTLQSRPNEREALLGRTLGVAQRLRREIEAQGGDCLVEFSGYKGYHLWIRFAQPLPAAAARRWLFDLAGAVEPLPEGVRIEIFPNRGRLRADQLGPVVKLPLGVHSRTGAACTLVAEDGRPVPDPFNAIRATRRVTFRASTDNAKRPGAPGSIGDVPVAAPATPSTPAPTTNVPEAAASPQGRPPIGPRARQMLDGCRILAWLDRKAESTAYLNHRERTSLLCTLGHLGEEGRAALHAIISHTYNYDHRVTDRHIDRLLAWPVSCPKLREAHPEAAAIAQCDCRFRPRDGIYPTPVLHALKPREIPAFRDRAAARQPATPAAGAPEHTRVTNHAPASAPLGNTLPVPPRVAAHSRAAAKTASGGDDAEQALRRIAELRRHIRGIEASLDRTYAELDRLFAAADTDSLEVASGTLVRTTDPSGARVFVMRI